MYVSLRAIFLTPQIWDTEDGRQGVAGNGQASRVWKGDGEIAKPIPQTRVLAFFVEAKV
jgi:hypothetical protein